jgi:exosortase
MSGLLVIGLLLVCTVPFALEWDSMGLLSRLVLEDGTFSQIPLIPIVSFFLIYARRKTIFAESFLDWTLGATLTIPGIILLAVVRLNIGGLSSINLVSVLLLASVFIWLGMFALFFGRRAFRAALFPLLFLLFVIPIPEPLLSKTIYFLQAGSSYMAQAFFAIAGIPYHREGFVFELPGVAIRVAEECSGIRSTLALLITTVLASYIFLNSFWRQLVLCSAVVPTAIFKNGLRIATLSILSIYVNPGFLYGDLHRRGGIVFFVIALVPIALLLKLLQKGDDLTSAIPAPGHARNPNSSSPPSG